MRIRPAAPTDTQALARVQVATWRTTYVNLLPADFFAAIDESMWQARWDRLLQAEGQVFVVESPASGIVGFASYGPNRDAAAEDIGELYSIYLLQASQGQGLGNELVRWVAGALSRQGFRQMRAWAFPPAHGFYLRMGGARIAERPITIDATTLVESCFQWAIRDA